MDTQRQGWRGTVDVVRHLAECGEDIPAKLYLTVPA